jgi:esterase/lipase
MHAADSQIENGHIFLFNHFARVETFIPQYLIYQETGAFCRSIASSEFFEGNDRFANALRDLGVVPNNHPHLMELLAVDVLRGRKIVIFPEGGMVKDRQVIDEQGRYSIYSRHAEERRKHHTGAARLAIGLRIFKTAVRQRSARNERTILKTWAEETGLGTVDALIDAAEGPLNIVPANITFYPLRISDNILRRSAEMLTGGLSMRAIDELVIEGNILLKATDMDINLGATLAVNDILNWYESPMVAYLARDLPNLGAVFDIDFLDARLLRRAATRRTNNAITRIRDAYMQKIYLAATVNLSHLASSIILRQVERGTRSIASTEFRRTLYLVIKTLQDHAEISLHRGLCDPEIYQQVLEFEPSALSEFLDSAASAGLIEHSEDALTYQDKLAVEHHFDAIRLENPIEVYGNEVEALEPVGKAVDKALARAPNLTSAELAYELYDDELKALAWDRMLYSKPKHADINAREIATADASPFLLVPDNPRAIGVVLVHGFLASPAEVRAFGEKLFAAGYVVMGVRLKGHGTSPWDLRDRSWRDWLASVANGRRIVEKITGQYALVGFSTGATLCLSSAAEDDSGLVGTVSIACPIKFRNRNMRLVPLMHGANRIVRWLSSYEGVMPFRPNDSEHPLINYRNMPLRGLYELTRLVSNLKSLLDKIHVPTCIVQATDDHVVDPKSANIAYDRIPHPVKELHWIESDRHGILNEDVGNTHQVVISFLERLNQECTALAPALPSAAGAA